MEIRRKVVEKLFTTFQKKKDSIVKGKLKGFDIYRTEDGDKIVTAKIKNGQGWYALVCFYDSQELMVDVYDMHVFDRYQKRFGLEETKDVISEFIGRGNCTGTMILENDNRFKKRVKDGATLGTTEPGIVYHKTYLNDTMIKENKLDYLLEL